ncbi:TPA: pirin family protein, partial [Acinetobacter baumannii]
MFDMRLSHERGAAHHGWLQSKHTFSFANYWDPKQVGFSDLLVINDDTVAPSKGFGTHPHRNMEIISYVLEGALEHKDSMGTGSVIVPGDIQLMSAGRGVAHSEFNHSAQENVHFLQIWVVPNEVNTTPGYQQLHISEEDKRGKLHLMISPKGGEKTLSIKQDINIYSGLFNGEETAEFSIPEGRYVGTVAKLAMRQPFVLFKGLTFQKLCLPGAFRPGDHHNKMLRPGLCVVHAS